MNGSLERDFDKSAKELAKEIEQLELALQTKRSLLNHQRSVCKHQWGETNYDPIIRKGYQDPGDGDNWHGADKRFPQWIPEQQTPVWKRTCQKCGLTEETRETRDDVTKVPIFR